LLHNVETIHRYPGLLTTIYKELGVIQEQQI
jgi:hypothetical protein